MNRNQQTNLDDVLAILQRSPRRRVLDELEEISSPTSVGELAFAMDGDAQRNAVALYHTHVPKLETFGAVVFDREAKTLDRGERFPVLRDYQYRVEATDDELLRRLQE